jgi:hypothetical protein
MFERCMELVLIETHNKYNTQYCSRTVESRNYETATDFRCETAGCFSMVTHVYNSDVSCWSTPRPYSNSTEHIAKQ